MYDHVPLVNKSITTITVGKSKIAIFNAFRNSSRFTQEHTRYVKTLPEPYDQSLHDLKLKAD